MSKYELESLKEKLRSDGAEYVSHKPSDKPINRRKGYVTFRCKCGKEETKKILTVCEKPTLCLQCMPRFAFNKDSLEDLFDKVQPLMKLSKNINSIGTDTYHIFANAESHM